MGWWTDQQLPCMVQVRGASVILRPSTNQRALMAFNISYIYQAIDKFSAVSNRINKSVERTQKKFRRLSQQMNKTRHSSKGLGNTLGDLKVKMIAVAAISFAAIKSYTGFEDALLGVAKTANIKVGPELDKFGDKFTALSLKIPISSQELLNLGKSAAQLGVQGKDNILLFAEVMGKLARTTNVAGEEGAAQMARLISITGASTDQVGNFASALVELGNTSAATEGEILHFATLLASRASVFGITGVQSLGLAAAMKSLGIQAELGGSSVGRGLGAINKAILGGAERLRAMSHLTGIAGENLKEAFGKNPVKVLQKFGAGLKRMEEKGADMTQMLAAFGLEGIRDLSVLGLLAKHTDLVTEKMNQSAKAYKENIALNKEFAVQMGSLSTKAKILWNHMKKLLINLVALLRPFLDLSIVILTGVIKAFNGFINQFPILSRFMGAMISTVALMAAGFLIYNVAVGIAAVTTGVFAAALAVIGFPITLIIAGITGLIALFVAFRKEINMIVKAMGEFLVPDFLKKGISAVVSFLTPDEPEPEFRGRGSVGARIAREQKALDSERVAKFGGSRGMIGVAAQAAQAAQTNIKFDGTLDVNAPPGVIKSATSKLSGVGGDRGMNMVIP